MKKKAISLCALLAVLAVLCGVYVAVTRLDGEDEVQTTAADTTVTLLSLDVETLTEIGYLADGEELRFTLADNAWQWSENPELNLDSTKFASMVSGLQPLTSTVTIAEPDAEMLASFGLDSPANRITLTDGAGTHTLIIGNYNNYNGCYYAAVDSTETVYMISAAVAEGFGLGITELLSYDTLPSITAGKLSSITLSRGEASRTYTYYGSGNPDCYTDTFKWFAADHGGEQTAVATSAGNSLSSAITSLAFSECVSYRAGEDAARYGLDDPATLTIVYRAAVETTDSTTGQTVSTDVERSTSLLVGGVDEVSGCYYATVEGSSLIYLLSSSSLPGLLEPTEALKLPTQVAPLNYDYVDKITFEAGSSRMTVVINRAEETTYTVGGESVEYSSLSSLFNAVQSLSAETTVADSSPDARESSVPTLRVTVTFNQGSVREAALVVTPYNTNFDRVSFAGREDQLISIRDTEEIVKLVEG